MSDVAHESFVIIVLKIYVLEIKIKITCVQLFKKQNISQNKLLFVELFTIFDYNNDEKLCDNMIMKCVLIFISYV